MKTTRSRQKTIKRITRRERHPQRGRKSLQPDLLDTKRAVFVAGEINGEMVAALTPQIMALRQASADPINVFIDSPGGDPRAAQVIRGLLKTPDQMGRGCHINTIATGNACSAGADLLAEGDYVAAYPHAYIHFHGTWTGKEHLTSAEARELSEELLSDDKYSSVELASAVFPRQLYNYDGLLKEIQQLRKTPSEALSNFDLLVEDKAVDVPAFAFALANNLQAPYQDLVWKCLEQTVRRASILKQFRQVTDPLRQLPSMLRSVIKQKNLNADAAAGLSKQLVLLNALISDCVVNESDWDLASENFSTLEQSFLHLREVIDGTYDQELVERVAEWGQLFMSPKDLRFDRRLSMSDLDNPKISAEYDRMVDRTSAKMEPLWSFTLTLCGLLNVGENPLTPNDAYWLGLIDEVVGTPLARRDIPSSIRASLLTQMPIAESQRFY